MSVLRKEYNLETHVDEVWYDSTNVVYSRFEENENENMGDLYVVFKAGKQYIYKNVSYADYLYFKNGLVEGSSGKALNEYIIKRYKGEKTDDADITELQERLASPREEESTYFIHGNGEFDNEILTNFYVPTVQYCMEISSDSRFVTTLYEKYGFETVKYMVENGADASKFTIYMRKSDELTITLYTELEDCRKVFIKDEEWDDKFIAQQLRVRSFEDIGYVSADELEKIREISPSAYNIIIRRFE
jgi:hypothetical protein